MGELRTDQVIFEVLGLVGRWSTNSKGGRKVVCGF